MDSICFLSLHNAQNSFKYLDIYLKTTTTEVKVCVDSSGTELSKHL